MTALYVASQNGHVGVVNILLQSGAHVDVPEEVSLTFSHSTDRAVNLKAMYVSQEHDYNTFIQLNVHICTEEVDSSDDSILQWTC